MRKISIIFSLPIVFSLLAARSIVAQSTQDIVIPKDSRLVDAEGIISRATGIPCVAQTPEELEKTSEAFRGSLTEALKFVSKTFDLHIIRRSDRILFYRRCFSGDEHPDLPLVELSSIVADLQRFIQPFYVPSVTGSDQTDRDALIGALTADQQRAIQAAGLPITALTPQQAKLWMSISSTKYYSPTELQLDRASKLLSHWKECRLLQITNNKGRTFWDIQYPDVVEPRGMFQIALPSFSAARAPKTLGEVSDWTGSTPKRLNLTPSFDHIVSMQSGTISTGEISDLIAASIASPFSVPSYAKERKLTFEGGRFTARLLVEVLSEMNGWHLGVDGKGHYALGRPRPVTPSTPMELYQAQLAAVPPSLRLLSSLKLGPSILWEARQFEIVASAHKGVPVDAGYAVKDLSTEHQERIAQAFILLLLRSPLTEDGPLVPELPPAYVLRPEAGVFRGAPVPGLGGNPAHPMIFFTVTAPGGGYQAWGWGVNDRPEVR